MIVRIIDDKKYKWHYENLEGLKIYFKGLFWQNNKYFCDTRACKKLAQILNNNTIPQTNRLNLENVILEINGHFSFIIDGDDYIIAAVDKIRSYPIFYYKGEKSFVIANSARKFQADCNLYEKDETSLLEFEMTGYVTGGNTLYKELYQLQAGEFLVYSKKENNFKLDRYYRFWKDDLPETDEDELLHKFHRALVTTFSKMIETLNGRPVWIPLSGGLDSRLVLAMLYDLKYDNITTFSYGIPGLWDIKQAQKIANMLNVKWHYIPYKPKKIKMLFDTQERKNYFDFASGLCSVPFLNDFYALLYLRNNQIISDDAIIINGQTGDFISGGHIPKILVDLDGKETESSILLSAIVNKHFSLWRNLMNEQNLNIIHEKILNLLQLTHDTTFTESEVSKYFELYEWQERQSKYVVNGQRIYDWFGYDWRLPLWSDEFMDFWVEVNWENKYSQRLYKKCLEQYDNTGVFKLVGNTAHPYAPIQIYVLNKIFGLICKIKMEDKSQYIRKYSQYFMTYAPFYPQKKYSDYLKHSQHHKNYISFLSKEYIENLKMS